MEGNNGPGRRAIQHLRTIVEAGERGYAVAAANVDNRALKMLFKAYARQRADFSEELRDEIGPATGGLHSVVDLLSMIHRGRIDIFAAMTIGELNRERMVLKEVLVGEAAAVRAYQRALNTDLPDGLGRMVREQYAAVGRVIREVELLRGKAGRQLVVCLYDRDGDAERAMKDLREAHFAGAVIEKVSAESEMGLQVEERHERLFETVLSGGAGGALWGAVSGALAGVGVLHLPALGLVHAPLATQEMAWALTTLGALLSGGFVGAMLGLFIGWGIHGADAYLYSDSQRRGQVRVRLETDQAAAAKAAQIMARVSREARSGRQRATA